MKQLSLGSATCSMKRRVWIRLRFAVALGLALLASTSTWFYVNRILIAQQIADGAAHDRPRGNLSDLYPRWLGARELLLHGRNPYSPEITREIQQGYYGRPLDPSKPDDPKDQQGFAYPAYVVFLLAPTIRIPFVLVQTGFQWLLMGLAAATIILWFRVLSWRASFTTHVICLVLMLGWFPTVDGIKLQQLSLVVIGLFAAAGACIAGGHLFCAGGVLALAMIKPQLATPLAVWLLLWAGSNWQLRRRFVFGFAVVMALLLGGSEFVLPGWSRMFIQAIRQYHQYVHNQSVLEDLFGLTLGAILAPVAALASATYLWRRRREPASSPAFGRSFALVLAATFVIFPVSTVYNQGLLVPTILVAVQSIGRGAPRPLPVRLARVVSGLLLIWPWIAAIGLTVASLWLTPALRQRVWLMPLYSSLMLPVFLFGLALLSDMWIAHRSDHERTAGVLEQ